MSEKYPKASKMSSVAEMTALCREVADHRSPTGNWKDRVGAVARTFGFSWGRSKSFYYATARRVDAEEMDRARSAISELRAKRQARELENSFRIVADRLRQIDPSFHRDTIDVLERAAASGRDLDRT